MNKDLQIAIFGYAGEPPPPGSFKAAIFEIVEKMGIRADDTKYIERLRAMVERKNAAIADNIVATSIERAAQNN